MTQTLLENQALIVVLSTGLTCYSQARDAWRKGQRLNLAPLVVAF
jgi:hypothetical protein